MAVGGPGMAAAGGPGMAAAGGAGTAASAVGGKAASAGAGTVAASGKGDALDVDPGTAGSGHGGATAVAPGLVADADGDGAALASGAASWACPEGGPPKKKIKMTKATESAIVPCVDGAPTRMCFPPSQSLETTTEKGKDVNSSAGALKRLDKSNSKKGKGGNSGSGASKRSRSGSNELPVLTEKTNLPVKVGAKKKKNEIPAVKQIRAVIPMVPLDSPAMGTRSKTINTGSPAMSTRSKRRLSL